MRLLPKLEDLVGGWTDPYEYECTVCDRAFQGERTTCPDCGGDVEPAESPDRAMPADPNP